MIEHYRNLLSDQKRITLFYKAIQAAVRPDSIVIEIGTALGTYAFFAAQSGAQKVYAIEMSDIFYVGRELARRNNLADKIVFLHGKSTDIELPERADIIIMEDYSPFFLYSALETVLADARERFLKPTGTFLPFKITLKMALAEYPSLHQRLDCFKHQKEQLYGLDWSYTTELAFNQTYYTDTKRKTLLTDEITLKTIDINHDTNFAFNFNGEIKVSQAGTIHGLIGWWDGYFTPELFYSNSPQQSSCGWGQLFFPLRYPIKVKPGEKVHVFLAALQSKHQKTVDYKWILTCQNQQQEGNTFRGSYLEPNQLIKSAPDSPVHISQRGEIVSFLLELCRQPVTRQKLAEILVQNYPHQFTSVEVALSKLPDLLRDLIQ